MNAVDYFGAEQTFSEGMRFFGLEGDSNLIPIFFAPPTQASGYSVIGNSYELRINMTNATDMAQFDFNWNGTNYTIYEGNLVFMANFNNDSSLGEDDLHPKDFSWYENNLTSVGATWTSSGKFGGAYSFDGSNDYINMTDFNASQTYGTISAWVNPKKLAVQNLFGTICPDLPSNSGIFALQIRQNTNYYFGLASRTQNVDNLALLAGSTQVSANNWYHVTLVSNGTYYFLYVDGNLESLTVLPGGSSGNNGNWYGNVCTDSNKTVVGGTLYDGTMDAFFNGTIDEVRIWNRSLSANEVKQIYYSNLQKYDTDKWSFYTNEQSLGSGIYAYRGHALDYYDGLNSTELRNVTIENKIVAISLPNSAVDFGDLTLGEQKANLSGMRVQNDGNVYLDIEINATRLFSSNSISYPGANYLFRVGDAGKGNESNGTYSPSSALSWTQFNSVPQFAIYSLNYSSTRNLAALQINITVPLDEAAGKKESTLVITANEA